MSEESITYTATDITRILANFFAAPLIISTFSFILYGANCYQFFNYFQCLARKDPILTKTWAAIVMTVDSAAVVYQVYFNWTYSINLFALQGTSIKSVAAGNSVVLYSVVVMLVQLFWAVCIESLVDHRCKVFIIGSIVFGAVGSFCTAIVVGVLSTTNPDPGGGWPTPTISIYLRTTLGLDLGIDLIILIAITTELSRMRAAFAHLRKTFSSLSYIFFTVTCLSTLIIIAELIINAPQPGGEIRISITFAAIIAPLYTFSLLSVLNARGEFWLGKSHSSSTQDGEVDEDKQEDRRPQMNFINEVYSRALDRDSRQLSLRNHAATEPANDIEREAGSRRSSMEESVDQRRYSNDGNADQIQSTQFGIQTI